MRYILIATLTLLLVSVSISSVWGQSSQQIGRYQLVSDHTTTMFMVDTVTGRAWRYSELIKPGGEKADSPCQGLTRCFIEVDRLRLTDSGRTGEGAGWASEILPPKH